MKPIALLAGLCGLAISAAACTPTSMVPMTTPTAGPASPPSSGATVAYNCPAMGYNFTITTMSSTQRRVTGLPVGDQIFTLISGGANAGQYESSPYRVQYPGGAFIILWDGGTGVDCYPA